MLALMPNRTSACPFKGVVLFPYFHAVGNFSRARYFGLDVGRCPRCDGDSPLASIFFAAMKRCRINMLQT
jgi:hypothetical protein